MRTVRYVGWALIACALLAVYAPLLGAPALSWDDGEHIFDNAEVRTGDFAAMWRSPSFGLYVPLTRTIWALTYQLGHGDVWPFRWLNLLLHLTNVVLVALLIRQLLAREDAPGRDESSGGEPNTWALLAGSALMALHPAQVAAVAWISGARDLISTMFALLAWWLIARPRSRWPVHATATAMFVAALLCKPQVVALPVALAVLWWIAQRTLLHERRRWLLLWTGLAIGTVLLTRYAQPTEPTSSLGARLLVAVDAVLFYVRLLAWPWPLAADYGRTPAWLLEHRSAMLPGLVAFALLATLAWLMLRNAAREGRAAVGSVIAFVVLLSPVLGLLPFSYQRISTVADHYLYLPMAAAALLLAVLVQRAMAQWHERSASNAGMAWRRSTALALAGVLAVALAGALSAQRAQVWAGGDERFYRAMLASNDQSWSARINLSVLLCERGDAGEGLVVLDGAATAAGTEAPYLANRAFCLMRAGHAPQVIALARVLTQPSVRVAFDRNRRAATVFVNSVAEALHVQGDEPSAFAYLCWSRTLAPGDADVANNLAVSTRLLQDDGPPVRCPDVLSWELLGELVTK